MAGVTPSMALTKRSADSALMPPPLPTKKIKRPAVVLDEEEYTGALSHIIARDFFPGLLETETQQEYLDALESKDRAWIASATQKLNEVMTPGRDGRRLRGKRGTSLATPISTNFGASNDTPRPISSSNATKSNTISDANQDVDTNMSLAAFQQRYTSEDNESFYKLLDKQNQKRAERYAWMWDGNKIPAARQIAHRKRQQLLADKSSQETAENGKALMKLGSGDARPAMPETWSGGPRNSFMFGPDSIEDDFQTVAQHKDEVSMAPPKAVVYDNTRINPGAGDEERKRASSPTLSTVKDAIAGRPRPTASEASGTGLATPRVNGYSFVDSEEPEAQESALTVSGQALSNYTGSSSNPFKLNESSSREALHHRMVDKILKGKRSTRSKGREAEVKIQDTPKFVSSPRIEKKGGLTPAAARLLGKVGEGVSRTPSGMWESRGKTPRHSGLRGMITPKTAR